MFNNLYGEGNCVDQINDCATTGNDEICETAVSTPPIINYPKYPLTAIFPGQFLFRDGRGRI